jgi:hypothetical protein
MADHEYFMTFCVTIFFSIRKVSGKIKVKRPEPQNRSDFAFHGDFSGLSRYLLHNPVRRKGPKGIEGLSVPAI